MRAARDVKTRVDRLRIIPSRHGRRRSAKWGRAGNRAGRPGMEMHVDDWGVGSRARGQQGEHATGRKQAQVDHALSWRDIVQPSNSRTRAADGRNG